MYLAGILALCALLHVSAGGRVRGEFSSSGIESARSMKNRYLALAVFAAAILLSMVREWSAPIACIRPLLEPQAQQSTPHAR